MDGHKKIRTISRPVVPKELLEDFRGTLRSYLDSTSGGDGAVTAQDLIPVSEDFYLVRILRRAKDPSEALRTVIEIAKWRKSFNPRDINPFVTCGEAFRLGVMYFHGKSRGGAHILVIRGSLIRKPKNTIEESSCRQYFIYFVEYAAVNLRGNITVLLDCQKTKIENLHMVYLRTMIDAFKTHYVDVLDYVLVFDLPVVLNACWKTLRRMIPSEGVDRTKMVNKKSILKYISQDNVPSCMGGTSRYAYHFDAGCASPPGLLWDLQQQLHDDVQHM